MRILITGSSGFIGSALMKRLLDKGLEVIGIDLCEPHYKEHRRFWKQADILDLGSLHNTIIPFAPTHIVHLAARTDLGLDDNLAGFKANTDGVHNILEICRNISALRRVIFASTILVCEAGYVPKSDDDYRPNTPYGESKMLGERIVREAASSLNFTWCIVRPTSIWGPGYGSHYSEFFRTIARGLYFHPGKANSLVVYGYIGNCVYQIEKIMLAQACKVHQKVFYLGDYWPTRLKEWANMIRFNLGKGRVRVLPDGIVRLASLCGDILWRMGWKKVPINTYRLMNMSTDRLYDTSETQAVVGDLPYNQQDAIKETIEWLQEHGEI